MQGSELDASRAQGQLHHANFAADTNPRTTGTHDDFDRMASLSSLRSELLPNISGWGSTLGHSDLLFLREQSSLSSNALLQMRQDALTSSNGLSALSHDELINLRAACLLAARSCGTEATEGNHTTTGPSTHAGIAELAQLSDLWNQQRRQLSEISNQARETAPPQFDIPQELKQQSSLDCLARAAEIAGQRGSPSSSLSDENLTLRETYNLSKKAETAKRSNSMWEKMKKASKNASNLKLGKATRSLMDTLESESSDSATRDPSSAQESIDKENTAKTDTNPGKGKAEQSITEDHEEEVKTNPTPSKKRKLNSSTERAKKKSSPSPVIELTAKKSDSSYSPSTLSTEPLAQFNEQQTVSGLKLNQSAAAVTNWQGPDLRPAPFKTTHTEPPTNGSDFFREHSLPLSDVSFHRGHNIVADEGQFDDPEDDD